MSYKADTRCTMCYKNGDLTCKTCKTTRYCSKSCQSADWKVHKMVCKQLASLPPRPAGDDSKEYVLGISLPVDSKEPKLVWVLCDLLEGHSGKTMGARADEILNQPGDLHTNSFKRNLLQGGLIIPRNILIYHRWGENTPVNQCIRRLNPGRSQPMQWRCSAVALHLAGMFPERYGDIKISDLRHIADFFAYHSDETPCMDVYGPEDHMDPPTAADIDRVAGIRINCGAAVEKLGRNKFDRWDVDKSNKIFKLEARDIPRMVGIPITVTKLPPNDGLWRLKINDKDARTVLGNNHEASALCVGATINPPVPTGGMSRVALWGGYCMQFYQDAGDCIAARLDGKPLLPEHVQVMSTYCRKKQETDMFRVQDMRGELPDEQVQTERERVNDGINRADFEKFWEDTKAENGWDGLPSPYEM